MKQRLIYLLPLAVFAVLAIYFAVGLTKDPRRLPSTLIDRPVPEFALPAIQGMSEGFSSADLRGQVTLVNIFGSWCVSCRVEHPFLMKLKAEKAVPIYGIDWRDKPGAGKAWLDQFGDPYTKVGDDQPGRTAIDFGVTGAPESFIVDKQAVIRYKHIGPIDAEVWKTTLLPIIEELRRR